MGACLVSDSISVMVNESPSKEFKIERGLRQGDPLSLFMFLIVVEALQISVLEACSKGVYKGITPADGGENISLLYYADDALFIGEWSRLNPKNLILILKCFENDLGLKVNLFKSGLFGIGIPNNELCDGWNEVINRFRERLSALKAKALLIGGRLMLVKSALGSLPIYYLSLFKAPKKSSMGDLGVSSRLAKNIGLLGKWKWWFLTKKEDMWRILNN
ncbi:reverse transcriptase domain, reverse transcriptase zinc-binding domain protein [Tanacetum coccineum]